MKTCFPAPGEPGWLKAESHDLEVDNPMAPAQLACPYSSWGKMQQASPIHEVKVPDAPNPMFLVTRKRDIDYIAQNPQIFSSNSDPKSWRWGDLGPEFDPIFAQDGYKIVHTLVTSDPPFAQKYRAFVMPSLGPRNVEVWTPTLQGIIDPLIEALPDRQPVDFIGSFVTPFTLSALIALLGLPSTDTGFIYDFTNDFMTLVDPTTPLERAKHAARSLVRAQNYLAGWIEGFRGQPAANLLSVIANARDEAGNLLSMEEALSMAFLMTIGGNETSRNGLGSIAFILARDRELWDTLQADPGKVSAFVDEALRVAAPSTTTPRRVLQDTQVEGVHLPKGSTVFLIWAAGGVDESVFKNPYTIDLNRKNSRASTTFGSGVHNCAGAHVARLELNLAVKAWLARFDSLDLAVPEADIHYEPVLAVRALHALPVRVTHRPHRSIP